MSPKRRNKKEKDSRLSMRMKITLGLGSIAVILLVSSVITVLEYRRMNNYVSDILDVNIKCIKETQMLSQMVDDYNQNILAIVGEDTLWVEMPYIDEELFYSECDSIRVDLGSLEELDLADSVALAFSDYVTLSKELGYIISSDFRNTRDWFFYELRPLYYDLQTKLNMVYEGAYSRLQTNSSTYNESFYRSITPGLVAVGAGLVLILLLLFFLIIYYVNPVYKMLHNIKNSLLMRTKYKCTIDGNDQMAELNERITDIMDENIELHRRVKALREDKERLIEQMESSEE